MKSQAVPATPEESVTAQFTAPCPNCKAIVAVDLTPAHVTPSKYIPAQFVPATYQPETVEPAVITGLRVVAPPPTPAPALYPPTIKLTGSPAKKFDTRMALLPACTVVDATGAEWKGQEHYPVHFAFKGKATWKGGRIIGTWPQDTTPWIGGYHSYTAMYTSGEEPTVEGLRVHDYGDGIRFMDHAITFFTLRGSWFSDMHDDPFEDDYLKSGLVEDCLFDGVHCGLSVRISKADRAIVTGKGNTLTVRKVLTRLKPFALTSDPAKPNTHGGFLKAENDDPAKSPSLVFEDCMWRADMLPAVHNLDLNPHGKATHKNCVLVWLGTGAYPHPIPRGVTMTKDVSVWDKAAADWKARHPAVAA